MQRNYRKSALIEANEKLIFRRFQKKLGLTCSEADQIHAELRAQFDFNKIDLSYILEAYRTNLKHLPALTGATLKEARLMLGLSRQQLAFLLGHRQSQNIHKQLYRMEMNMVGINPCRERLLRAYLSGYRPPDWPNQNGETP